MKKQNIYELAVIYRKELSTQAVSFESARKLRDIIKPFVEKATEIERDLNDIKTKEQDDVKKEKEAEILFKETCDMNIDKDILFTVLKEYKVSPLTIEFIDTL